MRAIDVFLRDTTRDAVAAVLNSVYPGQRDPWVKLVDDDPRLWIRFSTEDWPGVDHECWEGPFHDQFGGEPAVAITADISGRHPGKEQVLEFVSLLLGRFDGMANDDYTDRLWTLAEIVADVRHNGFPFFD